MRIRIAEFRSPSRAAFLTSPATFIGRERQRSRARPAPLLPRDRVRALAAALGRPLVFESQPDAAARKEMSVSMSAPVVEAMFRFFAQREFDGSQVLDTGERSLAVSLATS
jgi:hypothetical protein